MGDMLANAGMLMAIGMLTVFSFLTVLTFCVMALTRLTAEPEDVPAVNNQGRATTSNQHPDAAQMAAIAAAIAKYRNSHHSS